MGPLQKFQAGISPNAKYESKFVNDWGLSGIGYMDKNLKGYESWDSIL